MVKIPLMPVLILGYLLCIVAAWFLGALISRQVIRPLWRGTALFPCFRKERRLREKLREVKQQIEERVLSDTIEKQKATLKPDDKETV